MQYGQFAKLTQLSEITESMKPSIDSTRIAPQRPVQRMFTNLTEASEGISDLMGTELDSLFDEVTNALTENATPKTYGTAKPAVSHKDFVDNALKAKSAGEFHTGKKQDMGKQNKPKMFETDESTNSKVTKLGGEFKKYLHENLCTADNKHLIEAVNKVFDIMVLNKFK